MKTITSVILVILTFTFITSDSSLAQKKGKQSPKSEWKTARSGTNLPIKWKLEVQFAWSDETICYLEGDYKYGVKFYPPDNVALHRDDVIIVTGNTIGVAKDGDVLIDVSTIKNLGPK